MIIYLNQLHLKYSKNNTIKPVSIKIVNDPKDRKRNKTLGDNSLRTEILETISDYDRGLANTKIIDKELLQLYNSNIKILPHEFLFLMANSKNRADVITKVSKAHELSLEKNKKIRFFEDADPNQGINIFPLRKDDRTNKSPYRMMKRHLDREIIGKNIKI